MMDNNNRIDVSKIPPASVYIDSAVAKKMLEADSGRSLGKSVDRANTFEFIYGVLGLIVGVVCVVGGLILFLHGITGSTSWTAVVLGAESKVSDAAPGAVFGILGFFIIYVTRYRFTVGRR
jgi:hypothetical protein